MQSDPEQDTGKAALARYRLQYTMAEKSGAGGTRTPYLFNAIESLEDLPGIQRQLQ